MYKGRHQKRLHMTYQMGVIVIVAVCAGVLLIGALRKKSEWMLNFILRIVLGTISIYFLNFGLPLLGIEGEVGINAATVLTSGILGFPGVLALYGIVFVKVL